MKVTQFPQHMIKHIAQFLIAALLVTSLALPAMADAEVATSNPVITIKTSMGTIKLELYPELAPVTVANFMTYAEEGFYDGTLFHRIIPYFMIQGGGLDQELEVKPNHDPIVSEADNGLSNERGTIAMARTRDVNSAKSQFFINLENNKHLNYTKRKGGYTVFGKVTEGMKVVDQISEVETKPVDRLYHLPIEPVIIHSITQEAVPEK